MMMLLLLSFVRFVSIIFSIGADNWTPRRTGKGNVFKCFLACHRGQRVPFIQQPITIKYST